MSLRVLGILLCVGLMACAAATPPQPSLEVVLAQAQKERKPVVIEVFTTWCGPCKRFVKETLPDRGVQKALKDVLFVRYDAERGAGEQVATRYRVDGYPSFLVLDGSGALCKRGSGEAAGIKGFQSLLGQAAEVTRSRDAVLAELAAHKEDPAALLRAARWHVSHRLFDEGLVLYDQAASLTGHDKDQSPAEAHWEALKLRRVRELRRRTVQEARETVQRFPGSASAGHALPLAALTDELPREEVLKLVGEHLRALPDPPAQPPADKSADEAADALEKGGIVALAVRADEAAQAAAQRLIRLRPERLSGYLMLARYHSDRGDRQAALALLDRGEASCKTRRMRRAVGALRSKLQETGALPFWAIEQARMRVTEYFTNLEGGRQPLDGVTPLSPLLSVPPPTEVAKSATSARGG